MPCRLFDPKSFPEDSQVTCILAQPIYNCNFFAKIYTLLVSLVMFTIIYLAQNIHKFSQSLFPHVSCPEHSQMFTKFISTCLLELPRTFTNIHKVYFNMSLAQNIHKCSQSVFPHVSCPEHSQMFTKCISTRLLPRTFTNVHQVYFHTSLARIVSHRI